MNNARWAEQALLRCFYCTWTHFKLCSVINCTFKNKVQNTSQEVWGSRALQWHQELSAVSIQQPQIQLALGTASFDMGSCNLIPAWRGCLASQASPTPARHGRVAAGVSQALHPSCFSAKPRARLGCPLSHENYGEEEPCPFPGCFCLSVLGPHSKSLLKK